MSKDAPDLQLRPRQAKFAQEYVRDMNAKQAAIRAGYSPGSAHVQGHRLIMDDKVGGHIEVLARTAAEEAGIETVEVLKQLARIAFCDLRRMVGVDGKPIPLQHLPDDIAAAIQSVDIVPTKYAKDTGCPIAWAYRYRMCDRNSAIVTLMKHLGLFEKHNQQKLDPVSEFLSAIHDGGSRIPLKAPEEF